MRLLTTLLLLQLVVPTQAILRLGTINSGSVSGRVYLIDANTIFLYDFSTPNNLIFTAEEGATYTLTGGMDNHYSTYDLSADILGSSYLNIYEGSTVIATFYIPNNVYVPCDAEYLGRFARPGGASTYHQLDGFVFMDRPQRRFFIAGFNLDGNAPASYFWLDVATPPTASGIKTARVGSGYEILTQSQYVDVNVTFPPGQTNTQFKSLSVWCVDFFVSFGQVNISTVSADTFTCANSGPVWVGKSPPSHDVSANMYILGPNTIGLNALNFDGNAPATWYWTGMNSSLPDGYIVRDQYSSLAKLATVITNDNIVLTLPEGTDVCNAYFFSVYCVQAEVSFGSLYFADFNCSNCPATCKTNIPDYSVVQVCQDFSSTIRLEYIFAADFVTFKFHICGLEPEQYISAGLSGSTTGVSMVGGDVVVCYYTTTGEAVCADYSLTTRSQCSNFTGSYTGACPDLVLGGTDDIYNTQVENVNGRTTFTGSRKLAAGDAYDIEVSTTESQYIIWSKGGTFPSPTGNGKRWPLKHGPGDRASPASPIQTSNISTCDSHFQCTTPPPVVVTPWTVPPICIDDDSDPIKAYIGNTGASQGYRAITGKDGWGIVWYLNGLLVPEVYVKRGATVSFEVYGGGDPAASSEYHPLYITSSDEGGISGGQATDETVFAGLTHDQGVTSDLVTGDFCEWQENNGNGDQFNSWDTYKATLTSSCNSTATPGTFQWPTGINTPDVVYYQCATHRLLGWKIRVVDDLTECLQLASAYTLLPFSLLLLLAVVLTLFLGY